MKPLKTLVVLGTTLGLGSVTHLAAQESTPPEPPEPPAPPAHVQQLEKQLEHLEALKESATERIEQAMEHAQQAIELAQAQAEGAELDIDADGGPDNPPPPPMPVGPDAFWMGNRPAQSLIVQSSPSEPAKQTQIQEDLAVMSRLLDKAAGQGGGDRAMRVLGLELMFTPGAQTQRALALDGYGALFFLPVNIPLLPVAEGTASAATNAPKHSAWEETRRELYSPKSPGFSTDQLITTLHGQPAVQAYDEAKVTRLKDAIIDTLKQAANMRHLKPDEFVTVVVTGPAAGRSRFAVRHEIRRQEDGDAEDRPAITIQKIRPGESAAGNTVMTIRARKSDIDAAAKAKSPNADFKSNVTVTTYTLPVAAPRTNGE
jgi:hypothetical protein